MTRLPRVGTVAYNGFKFPAPFQSTVSGVPVFDSSGRTVKYYQWIFRVEGVLVSEDLTFAGSPQTGVKIDFEMDTLRVILTTPGREFVFFDQGFGDLVVNKGFASTSQASSASKSVALDAVFGPKPRFSSWQPRGSNHAVFINWECEIQIPQTCLDPVFRNTLAEYNYSTTWSIDQGSRTVRTTNVTMEIPMTRRNATSRLTPTSIDRFRNLVKVQTLASKLSGFHRSSNFTESEDKRIMRATIVDTEIPSSNPYFVGMVNMNVTHSVSNKNNTLVPDSNQLWTNTISGRVEVAPNFPKALGWIAIQNVIIQRMDVPFKRKFEKLIETKTSGPIGQFAESLGLISAPTPVLSTQITTGLKLITALSLQEEVYGHGISFSIEYIIATTIENLVRDSGLFTTVPGSWTKWRASLDTIDPNRGYSGLQGENNDVIIDLCLEDSQPIRAFIFPSSEQTARPFVSSPGKINAEDTWITFENTVFKLLDTNAIELIPLHSSKTDADTTQRNLESQRTNGQVPFTSTSSKGAATVQSRADTQMKLRMMGKASRVGLKPIIPRIISVGGLPVTNVGNPVTLTRQRDTPMGVPLFTSRWSIDYRVSTVRDLKPDDIKIVNIGPGEKTNFTL